MLATGKRQRRAAAFPTRSVGSARRCRSTRTHAAARPANSFDLSNCQVSVGLPRPLFPPPSHGFAPLKGRRWGLTWLEGGGIPYSRRRPAGFGSLINGGSAHRSATASPAWRSRRIRACVCACVRVYVCIHCKDVWESVRVCVCVCTYTLRWGSCVCVCAPPRTQKPATHTHTCTWSLVRERVSVRGGIQQVFGGKYKRRYVPLKYVCVLTEIMYRYEDGEKKNYSSRDEIWKLFWSSFFSSHIRITYFCGPCEQRRTRARPIKKIRGIPLAKRRDLAFILVFVLFFSPQRGRGPGRGVVFENSDETKNRN